MKSIYELVFGEAQLRGDWEVMRVPGGWIFLHYGGSGKTSTFVPYNSEFDDRPIEPTPKPFIG